jgi:hypothetical protein
MFSTAFPTPFPTREIRVQMSICRNAFYDLGVGSYNANRSGLLRRTGTTRSGVDSNLSKRVSRYLRSVLGECAEPARWFAPAALAMSTDNPLQ